MPISKDTYCYTKKTWTYKRSSSHIPLEIIDVEIPPVPTSITNFIDAYEKELDAAWLSVFAKYQSTLQNNQKSKKKDYIDYNDFLENCISSLVSSSSQLGTVRVISVSDNENSQHVTLACTTPESSLLNCLRYSPAKLRSDPVCVLYILYQVIYWLQTFHANCLPHCALTLDNIFIDENLTVRLGLPDMNRVLSEATAEAEEESARKSISTPQSEPHETLPGSKAKPQLAEMVQAWVLGKVSNIDYIMFLNRLSGRCQDDPNNHPMLPWVTDFSVAWGGYRDLSKSKFRLNKGDSQLDQLFQQHLLDDDVRLTHGNGEGVSGSMEGYTTGNAWAPHHVSDAMCEITYYSYKARRTGKEVLKRYVRPQWRPQEYPYSMERMYHWTPDECIPEFFEDPEIFLSIHSDMADLQLPEWCSTPEEFLCYHRAMLESDPVSRNLHDWIDITFGYKLSGDDAINAKNVFLQVVDGHSHLRNSGITQLFTVPHPRRCPEDIQRYFGPERPLLPPPEEDVTESSPSTSDIGESHISLGHQLPSDYDALALMKVYEELYTFIQESCHSEPPPLPEPAVVRVPLLKRLLREDILSVGCLVMEMFLFDCISPEQIYLPTVPDRVAVLRELYHYHGNKLSSSVSLGLEAILQPRLPNPPGPLDFLPSPNHLLHALFAFPPYMSALHRLVTRISDHQTNWNRVDGLYAIIRSHGVTMPREGLALLTPHVVETFAHPHWGVAAAWRLFSPYASLVGRMVANEELLPALLIIYSNEFVTRKHVKLYEKSFMRQLFLHLGLRHFLAHMPHLLIEAVAGYKDQPVTSPGRVERQRSPAEVKDGVDLVFGGKQVHRRCPSGPPPAGLTSPRLSSSSMEEDLQREILSSRRSMDFLMNSPSLNSSPTTEALFVRRGQEDTSPYSDQEIHDDRADTPLDIEFGMPEGDSDITLRETRGRQHVVVGASGYYSSQSVSRIHDDDDEDDFDSGGLEVKERRSSTVDSISVGEPANGKEARGLVEDYPTLGGSAPSQLGDLIAAHLDPKSGTISAAMSSTSVTHDLGESSSTTTANDNRATSPRSHLNSTENLGISDVAAETVVWLAEKLGPVLTAQYITRNLLRMLVLCYSSVQQLQPEEITGGDPLTSSKLPMPVNTTRKVLLGDAYASRLLLCLKRIACIYGEYFLLGQYLPFIKDCIKAAQKELPNGKTEGGLVACIVLLQQVVTYMPDRRLMDCLPDSILKEILLGAIRLASSLNVVFPSGAVGRRALLYKVIDSLYVIGLRLGFEMTRSHMTGVFQRFFASFGRVYQEESVRYLDDEDGEMEKVAVNINQGANSSYNPWLVENDASTSGLNRQRSTGAGSRYVRETSVNSMAGPGMESLNEYYLIKVNSGTQEVSIDPAVPSVATRAWEQTYQLSPRVLPEPPPGATDRQMEEMRETFTPELAHLAYVPFCRLAGGIHMDNHLYNADLIRSLVTEHERAQPPSSPSPKKPGLGSLEDASSMGAEGASLVGVGGGGSTLGSTSTSSRPRLNASTDEEGAMVRCRDLELNRSRHMSDYWATYFDHELGLNERTKRFDFKQIKLMTLTGHVGNVRAMQVLDLENGLISCGKDKTVRLWSLKNQTNSERPCEARFTYRHHKKAVFAAQYLETMRLVASCDGTIHLWDPFTGKQIRDLSNSGRSQFTVLSRLPAPHCSLVAGDTDNYLNVMDARTGRFVQRMASGAGYAAGAGIGGASLVTGATGVGATGTVGVGALRHVTVSPRGNTVICAFASGHLTALDRRTGCVMHTWRGHTDDICQMKFFPYSDWFFTSSYDQTIVQWQLPTYTSTPLIGSQNETVTFFDFYRDEMVASLSGSRFASFRLPNQGQIYTSFGKLRPTVFKGMVTTFSVLPMNRLMLVGSDSGNIVLFC